VRSEESIFKIVQPLKPALFAFIRMDASLSLSMAKATLFTIHFSLLCYTRIDHG
jgi:hypothetical protein